MPAGGGTSADRARQKKGKTAAERAAITKKSGEAGRAARERYNAANTSSYQPSGGGRGSSGGGAAAAPVSTLAGLPQSPLLDTLIKNGLIKEGMPAEQALAVLKFAQLREGVPINVAELMKLVSADYAKTTGDITTAGGDWMHQLLGTAAPITPQPGWNYENGQWLDEQGNLVGTAPVEDAQQIMPAGISDPNAGMFYQDPIFSSYAGGLAQMQETADTNEATDLAWFRKNQEAQEQYYNDMMTAISTGTLPIGAAAAGGGGGGGGGGGRGGRGGGGGGSGGGNDWSDPRTEIDLTERAQTTDESVSNALYPEFYQKLVENAPTDPASAYLLEMIVEGKDPQGTLQAMQAADAENTDFLTRANDIDINNAAFNTGMPAMANRELAAYRNLSGFDPASGEVPNALAWGPTDENGEPIQVSPEALEGFERQRDLAVAAYDPGEVRRTAYEQLFDRPEIQQLLGLMEKPPPEAPANYNVLSGNRTGTYSPPNTGISGQQLEVPSPRQQQGIPVDPNDPASNPYPNVNNPFSPSGPIQDSTWQTANSAPELQSRQEFELQSQIDDELASGGTFNMIEDYDPSDPLKNVRTILATEGGRTNLDPYFREAYSQLPPGQRAAVNTYLQQRGIDTPEGTSANYQTKRENRTTPAGPRMFSTEWVNSMLGTDLANNQQLASSYFANPGLMNAIARNARGTNQDGEQIDFAPEDINRAFASTPVENGKVRGDIADILRLWSPTEEERTAATVINPETGKSDFLASRIGPGRYFQEQEPEEEIEEAQNELEYNEWGRPIAIAANPYMNFAAYKDSDKFQAQETERANTDFRTYSPEWSEAISGLYDPDEFTPEDPGPLDIIEEFGGYAGQTRGGIPSSTRQEGQRVNSKPVRTVTKPTGNKTTFSRPTVTRNQRSTPATRRSNASLMSVLQGVSKKKKR